MIAEQFVDLVGTDPVVQAVAGGVVIAVLNLFGASLVLVWRNPSERALDGALGFAAGIMLAAAFTSLILPGIEATPGGSPLPVLLGIVLGVLALDRADVMVPQAHYLLTGRKRSDAANPSESLPVTDERLSALVLIILAITLHNMPEGLSVGVGFGSGEVETGIALLLAIGIQNTSKASPSRWRPSTPAWTGGSTPPSRASAPAWSKSPSQ